jgi:hypothetical protein
MRGDKKSEGRSTLYFGLSDLSYFRSQITATATLVNKNLRLFLTAVSSDSGSLPNCELLSTDLFAPFLTTVRLTKNLHPRKYSNPGAAQEIF